MKELPNDYGTLTRELLNRAAIQRQPAYGTFELTNRCNLICNMCYVRHPAGDKVIRQKELTSFEWLEIARQAKDNGMVFLLLTGGEIFLRRDFFEIYEPLTRFGFIITLFTNSTLITDDIADRLAQIPPTCIETTLYGATNITYEKVTGIPGSYSRCCVGIESLIKRGIKPSLKATITQQNIHELDAMREMSKVWGLPFKAGWILTGRPDGGASDVVACRLSACDCVELETSNKASPSQWDKMTLRKPPSDNNNFNCVAGKSAFYINPFGEMGVCLDLPLPAARPLNIGFIKAWEEIQKIVDSASLLSKTCYECSARGYCQRCPAWSYIENKTLNEPVSYLCEISHARKKRYEIDTE